MMWAAEHRYFFISGNWWAIIHAYNWNGDVVRMITVKNGDVPHKDRAMTTKYVQWINGVDSALRLEASRLFYFSLGDGDFEEAETP